MKKSSIILAVIILMVILQVSVLPLYFSKGNIPDLALVFIISGVSVFGFNAAWLWAIAAGFILDIFSFSRVGVNVFSFMFFSYSTSFFSRRLILGEKISGIAVGGFFIALATFLNSVWINFAESGLKFQELIKINFVFSADTGWKIIFNLILFFVFIIFLKQIRRKFNPPNNLIVAK
jgi:rod shape-determining protein MreD